MLAWVDAAEAAMQLTVKALQGRECSLQVASPGPRRPPRSGLRAGLRVGIGRAGTRAREARRTAFLGGRGFNPLLPPSAWPGVGG